MNQTLAIETCRGSFANGTSANVSSERSEFAGETASTSGQRPKRRSVWKFEERFEALIGLLSVVYLLGAFGFGGLLVFYILSR
jgi:hypothetical protein